MTDKILLCSNCFNDEGLRLDSIKLGFDSDETCPNCKTCEGKKLNHELLERLAYRFFVKGTLHKSTYGAAPVIQFNYLQQGTKLDLEDHLQNDVELIQKVIKIGFFYYGPRHWMLGEIYPLKSLQSENEREKIINRIINEFPMRIFSKNETFYRLRKNPEKPEIIGEYDSPPGSGTGRFDSLSLPILYGSQDIEVCVHECRVTVEDELYIAFLKPNFDLKLLDLTIPLKENGTEFESLDLAVHFLFHAGNHSYEISREIALYVKSAGYDGIIYPSYFSNIKTGATPFETVNGISIRKLQQYQQNPKFNIIPNIGLFDRPIKEGKLIVKCINKLHLKRIQYDLFFGPVRF